MKKIGKYEIIERLGGGGMGVVYKAHDPSFIDRDVAIKVISEEIVELPGMRERFYREARSAGKLLHENLTIVYDVGETDGKPYIVMEYLQGDDLRSIIDEKEPLPLIQKLNYAKQICKGLEFVHAKDIIHRDIKPGNIKIVDDSKVKIMDFGIAKPLASNLTRPGTLLGTPSYMSPEQIKGEEIDQRSDIFSFGILFYELLAYKKPFAGDENTVMYKIVHEEPERLRLEENTIVDALQALVSKCLRKKARERYHNFSEILVLLEGIIAAVQTNGVKKRSPQRLVISLSLAIIVLALGLWVYFRNQSLPDKTARIIPQPVNAESTMVRQDNQNPTREKPSPLIMELAGISEIKVLREKLIEYRDSFRIAIGDIDDFEPPDGCYVFVVDTGKVWGVYKFEANLFYNLKSEEKLSDLSERFSGKKSIWVQDLTTQF